MPTYVLSYRNPAGHKPTPDSMSAWMAWFDSMGDHLVELGKPVVTRTAVGHCSSDNTELGGYSLIQADDLDAAAVIAKGCPTLDRDGGVEVGELGEVPDPTTTG